MVLTASRRRTATSVGTLIAFILVLVFGSPWYGHWVAANAGANTGWDLFLRTLNWPAWTFDENTPVRDVLAQDLKAILVVVFTAVFLTLLASAELARARGTFASLVTGWGAYIFAAALAGLITAFVSVHASAFTALTWAMGGAGYGLLVGWIIGLAQMGARRP
jgi:hypothetical protein